MLTGASRGSAGLRRDDAEEQSKRAYRAALGWVLEFACMHHLVPVSDGAWRHFAAAGEHGCQLLCMPAVVEELMRAKMSLPRDSTLSRLLSVERRLAEVRVRTHECASSHAPQRLSACSHSRCALCDTG